ncbi:MAG TPA: NUDIX hydrolase [Longimicrobiales bacterium]|nr:NUDIX hydrolase [Longimicrobiales bacterium]
MRLETSAGGVVYRREEGVPYFLLIRDPYENWGLPKGHVEKGETPGQAALREVREETGIEAVELRERLDTIDWYFREGPDLIHKYCHFFLMETIVEETRPQFEEGITECIWLTLDEALRTLTYDNARQVLDNAGHRVGALEPGA